MDIDGILRGSSDMHLHNGPDAFRSRRLDALQAATQAQQSGMRSIVLKSHIYPTAPLAMIVNQLVPGIKVFGSICLDSEIGGLNPYAVETSAKMGAKVVWMPTASSANSVGKMPHAAAWAGPHDITIIDQAGKLVPEVEPILALLKEYDMVLATGHISPAETFALVTAARRAGIWRIVITHAASSEFLVKPLTLDDQRRLAEMGAFIEYCGSGLLPTEARHDPAAIAAAIKSIGPEHFVISTDLGQEINPTPDEGMRRFIVTLLRQGLPESAVELMAKVNPARLLGLD